MTNGIPANTNPFVVLISWRSGDPEFHKIAPQYFRYDSEVSMPLAREIIGPEVTKSELEKLIRALIGKRKKIPLAVHDKFSYIIPRDLCEIIRIAQPYSASHSKVRFFVPCCTEDECRYKK